VQARIVVGAVLALAAAAAGDALVGGAEQGAVAPTARDRDGREETGFALAREGTYEGDGRFLETRVLRAGREHLSAEAVAAAFPGADSGLIDILRIAVAPDGTLVLGIIRFPPGLRAQSGVELWRGRRLRGAFTVEPGSFGGGFAFDRAGELIALFSHDGALRGVYDLSGRRLEDFPDRFLLGR
jgi:hypothetical protein